MRGCSTHHAYSHPGHLPAGDPALMLAENERSGGINILNFYARRMDEVLGLLEKNWGAPSPDWRIHELRFGDGPLTKEHSDWQDTRIRADARAFEGIDGRPERRGRSALGAGAPCGAADRGRGAGG